MAAELIAAAATKRIVDWLGNFLKETQAQDSNDSDLATAPLILNDNQACITILSSRNLKGGNRHLRLRYYGIREAIAKGKLVVKHIAGADMVADGLMKPLARVNHEKFMQTIGLVYVKGHVHTMCAELYPLPPLRLRHYLRIESSHKHGVVYIARWLPQINNVSVP